MRLWTTLGESPIWTGIGLVTSRGPCQPQSLYKPLVKSQSRARFQSTVGDWSMKRPKSSWIQHGNCLWSQWLFFRINLTCQCHYFSQLLTGCVTVWKQVLNQLCACSGHSSWLFLCRSCWVQQVSLFLSHTEIHSLWVNEWSLHNISLQTSVWRGLGWIAQPYLVSTSWNTPVCWELTWGLAHE